VARFNSPTKRIVVLTYGSCGNVQPFIALGVGLLRAGHAGRLVRPTYFGPLVWARGVAFTPLGEDPCKLTHALSHRAGLSRPRMGVDGQGVRNGFGHFAWTAE